MYVEPGNEAKYEQVLGVCRQAAVNRQITKSQESQLRTITGAVEGTVAGAAFGAEFGSILKSGGWDVDVSDSALGAGAIGLVTSLASSFARGAEETATATKSALLRCLEATSNNGSLWKVLE